MTTAEPADRNDVLAAALRHSMSYSAGWPDLERSAPGVHERLMHLGVTIEETMLALGNTGWFTRDQLGQWAGISTTFNAIATDLDQLATDDRWL